MNNTPSHDDAITAEPTRFEMIPHWIMDHSDITPNAIRLYLQLRRYTGKELTAYPSRKRLASDLNLTVPTVDTATKVLVAIGAITVRARHSATGDQTSNLYTVNWSDPVNNPAGGGKKIGEGVAKKTYPGSPKNEGTNLYPFNLDPLNLDKEQQAENLPVIPKPLGEFDSFWKAYPRKASKGAARKAWIKAVVKVDPQVIINAAHRLASDPNREPQFTPHAATWLNDERWDDEPLPSKAGPKNAADRRMDQYEELLQNIRARSQGAIDE